MAGMSVIAALVAWLDERHPAEFNAPDKQASPRAARACGIAFGCPILTAHIVMAGRFGPVMTQMAGGKDDTVARSRRWKSLRPVRDEPTPADGCVW